jgi:hypothetical protein
MNQLRALPLLLVCGYFVMTADLSAQGEFAPREEGKAEAEAQFAKETYKRLCRDLKKSIGEDVQGNDSSYEQQALDVFEGFEAALEEQDWQQVRNFASSLQSLQSRHGRLRKEFSLARKYLESLRRERQKEFLSLAKEGIDSVSDGIRGLLRPDVTTGDVDAIENHARKISRQLEVLGYDGGDSSIQTMTSILRGKIEALGRLRPVIAAARSRQPQVAVQRLLGAISYNSGNQGEFTSSELREFGLALLGRENAVRHGLIVPASRAELKWFRDGQTDRFAGMENSSSSWENRVLSFHRLDTVFTLVEAGQPESAIPHLLALSRHMSGPVWNLPILAEAERVTARGLLGKNAPEPRPDDKADSYLARILADAASRSDFASMENVVRAQQELQIGENHASRIGFLRAMQLGDALAALKQNGEAARAYREALGQEDSCGVRTQVVLAKILALHEADPGIPVSTPAAPAPAEEVTPEAAELRIRAIRYQILELGKQLEALAGEEGTGQTP